MSNIQLWHGPNGVEFPSNISKPKKLMTFANENYLSKKQQNQIVKAFKIEAYDMASEYAWKKAMVKLKETLGTLGAGFIGEMLGRPDIENSSVIEEVLTDHEAITLAEQLGVIGNTAAIKLRQSNELIAHFFSKNANEELDQSDAFQIVKSSVKYILGEQDVSIALDFLNFRDRLLAETLTVKDSQVEQLINSPIFYLRTVITILISAVKKETGAKLELALANFNTLLPAMWKSLGESDRYNVGMAYRDVTAAGKSTAIKGLKSALIKVKGFDYVPENLRSSTFRKTAIKLKNIHFGTDNFHNELAAVKKLAQLGSIIPSPAFSECIQAYLCVYLGNYYGESWEAAPIAEQELSKIRPNRWEYYFTKIIHNDDVILNKINENNIKTISRFSGFLIKNSLSDFIGLPKDNQRLYNAILKKEYKRVGSLSKTLLNRIKG